MAGGRKRHRSVGPLYGGGDVHSSPGTYALDWVAERADGRERAEALIDGKSTDRAADAVVVQRVWESVTGHSLKGNRIYQFRGRVEVVQLGEMAPIRMWTGAAIAQRANSAGHLLLDEWCRCAAGASSAELDRARARFLEVWPSLTSGVGEPPDPTS